ncbi:MAG: D-alanyl-D-alanine carboxypeptidase, partial [Eggerthellaceae bacterium]|nr:D-alanyl-D-alanine carboxypeptidase [Eggerthellaceae bacterium]
EVEYQYPKGVVRAGDVVGTITYKQRNEIVATANLVAARDLPGPNVFEMISIWWSRLVGGFMGDDGVADPKLYNQMPVIRDNNAL